MVKTVALSMTILFLAVTNAALADEPWEIFSASDPDSETVINHQPLTDYLQQTVLPVGRSKMLIGPKGNKEQYLNSKITIGNYSPSRAEGNRILIHAFADGHKDFFKAYQVGLENLSNRVPISSLGQDEQLAFWLNLYNVIVINKLVEEYPVKNLKFLRFGKNGGIPFWQQKVTVVEGVPLSLTDIEQILFKNWNTPLVIYGLWQGSIGGPRLANQAFTGDTVWKLLDQNAEEFVNSNRGVRPRKNKLIVSDFYDWMADAFPGTGYSLRQHIDRYANPGFLGDIDNIEKTEPDYYDWIIADLIGGVLHEGSTSTSTLLNDFLYRLDPGTDSSLNRLPPQALELIEEIAVNNDLPKRIPIITTEECAPDDPCGAKGTPDK